MNATINTAVTRRRSLFTSSALLGTLGLVALSACGDNPVWQDAIGNCGSSYQEADQKRCQHIQSSPSAFGLTADQASQICTGVGYGTCYPKTSLLLYTCNVDALRTAALSVKIFENTAGLFSTPASSGANTELLNKAKEAAKNPVACPANSQQSDMGGAEESTKTSDTGLTTSSNAKGSGSGVSGELFADMRKTPAPKPAPKPEPKKDKGEAGCDKCTIV